MGSLSLTRIDSLSPQFQAHRAGDKLSPPRKGELDAALPTHLPVRNSPADKFKLTVVLTNAKLYFRLFTRNDLADSAFVQP